MERVNKPLVTAFAATLKARRRAVGLSQEELAARADISVRHLSYLENGDRQPSLTIFAALSDGLDVDLADFAGEVSRAYRRRSGSEG